jgi:amino acid adenylation domain-containing protein
VVRHAASRDRVFTAPFSLLAEEVRSRLPEDVEDAFPLGRLQAGMLFHSNYAPGSGVYHDVISYRFNLPYDAEKFQRTVDRLTQRHDMLRTSIDIENFTEPLQLVHRHVDLPIVMEDWRLRTPVEQEEGLIDFEARECRTGFALEQAPQMRVFVHWLSENTFQCSFSFHHAIMDGWSEASLVTELLQDYERQLAGDLLETDPLGVTYRDYIALERQVMASEESLAFWRQTLQEFTLTPAPLTDLNEEKKLADPGKIPARAIVISEDTQNQVRILAREMRVPLKTVLLAAHMKVLQMLSGQRDVTTGVVLNGRLDVERGDQVIGLFLNTLPFRLRVESQNWRSLIRDTFAAEQRILPHRRYPLADLQAQLGRKTLFETAFNYLHFHVYKELEPERHQGRNLIAGRTGYARQNIDFLITFELSADTKQLQGTVQSDTALMNAAVLERVAGYYETILARMMEDNIGDLRPKEEIEQIEHWNKTTVIYPRERMAHELIEEQVKRSPEAVAVVYEDEQLTYGELNERANRVRNYLRRLGVKPDMLVAICVERSVEMMVALLGVWKAGGAYVPLDANYPVERLRYMLEDSGAVALLTQAGLREIFAVVRGSMAVVELEHVLFKQETEAGAEGDEERVGLDQGHLAYVIYTSGSTGTPKAVMVEHGGMLNHLYAKVRDLGISRGDVIAQTASLSFDISVWQLVAGLLVGGKVVIVGEKQVHDAEGVQGEVGGKGVTIFETVPSMLEAMTAKGRGGLTAGENNLRWVLVTGEACTAELARRWKSLNGEIPLLNAYGPTECSDDVTHYGMVGRIEEGMKNVPIGKPVANTRIYIVDREMEAVPVGVAGELYIGGAGVGRGYLKRAELTAERFVPDGFSEEWGARCYRSGDLGKWLKDGNIEFLGRNDHQVKVRGYRIELGEIEERLMEHGGVGRAVVVAREDGSGDKRLVAYYTYREDSEAGEGGQEESKGREGAGAGRIGAEELQEHVRGRLPEYMVPAAYVWMEKLPLTENGKVDRKRLPEPEGSAYAVKSYEAPEGEIETALASIWEDLLKVERVGRHDNFFALGGHSLLVTQLVARIEQAIGVKIGIRVVFESAQLSLLATQVRCLQFAEFDSEEFAQMMHGS